MYQSGYVAWHKQSSSCLLSSMCGCHFKSELSLSGLICMNNCTHFFFLSIICCVKDVYIQLLNPASTFCRRGLITRNVKDAVDLFHQRFGVSCCITLQLISNSTCPFGYFWLPFLWSLFYHNLVTFSGLLWDYARIIRSLNVLIHCLSLCCNSSKWDRCIIFQLLCHCI